MPILTIQRRMRELGRIRLGQQVPIAGKPGKTRPEKLSTFRLTSASKEYVEAAAAAYGGTVSPWESPRGREWETVIESPFLDVIVLPGEVVDPWFEMWTGGGCVRRCDGITEQLSGQPCLCPAAPKERQELAGKGKACKATTRLNVALPALPDLGVWRLETHSFYAAVEVPGAADVLRQAAEQGVMIRARLRIDHRQVRRPGEPTRDFIVPVLEFPDLRLDSMLAAGPMAGSARQLGAGSPAGARALPPGPALPERSAFRPAPAPVAAPADEDLEEAAYEPIDDFAPTPGASVALALTGEAFPEYLREHGVTDGAVVRAVKEQLFGDRTSLNNEERGQLAIAVVRAHGEDAA